MQTTAQSLAYSKLLLLLTLYICAFSYVFVSRVVSHFIHTAALSQSVCCLWLRPWASSLFWLCSWFQSHVFNTICMLAAYIHTASLDLSPVLHTCLTAYSTSPLGRGISNSTSEADLLLPVKAAPPISANGSTVLSGAQVKNLWVFLYSSFFLTLHIQPLNPLGTIFKIYPESSNFSPPPITTLAKTLSPLTCNLSPLTEVTFLFVHLAILSISALTLASLLIMGSLLSSQLHGEL